MFWFRTSEGFWNRFLSCSSYVTQCRCSWGHISRAISKGVELAIGEAENIFEDQWLLLYVGPLEHDFKKAYGLFDMLNKHRMLKCERLWRLQYLSGCILYWLEGEILKSWFWTRMLKLRKGMKYVLEMIRWLFRQELKKRAIPSPSDCKTVVPLADGQIEKRVGLEDKSLLGQFYAHLLSVNMI